MKFIPNSRVRQAKKGIHTLVLPPCMTKELGYGNLKKRLESEEQLILSFQTAMEENDTCNRCHGLFGQLLEEKVYILRSGQNV